jgi:hypothetical protein
MIPPVSESNPADPVVGLPKFDACGKLQAWNMPREICDDLELRGPLQFTETYRTGGGDFPDAYNMATWFRSFAGGSYDSKNKNGEPYSIPLWAAQYDRANFPLKCNKWVYS